MTTTKTFIRGEIGPDERFFLVAQQKCGSGFDAKILNYYSVKRNKKVAFTTYKDGGEPMYFSGSVKKGMLFLYINGNLKTQEGLTIAPMRNVDNSAIYAGMWYKITTNNQPVNWSFLTPTPCIGSSLVGNSEFGYLTTYESSMSSKPDDACYCILPEFFHDASGKRYLTIEILRQKVINRSELRGFTLSYRGSEEWFEYPRWDEPQYSTGKITRGGPKRGNGRVEKPQSKRAMSFTDLKNDRKPRETTTLPFPLSFFSRDQSPPADDSGGSNDGGAWFFWIGLITGMILVSVIIGLVYLLFSPRPQMTPLQEIKSS
jgi:hypothetical protein